MRVLAESRTLDEAAAILGINVTTFWRKTKALGHQVILAIAAFSAGNGRRPRGFKMQCIVRFAARWT
jgi:hypothetical protein